uniref:Movement protein n=1 Tax=Toxocara canis TaxID=6265 RepID=A0A183V3A3_TOXCA
LSVARIFSDRLSNLRTVPPSRLMQRSNDGGVLLYSPVLQNRATLLI